MAGSVDDLGAPDSWEMADLEERVSRLLVSPSTKDSALGFVEEPSGPDASDAFAAAAATPPHLASLSGPSSAKPAASGGSGRPSDELIAQVDQFLREALEKPRERISILRMEHDVENFIRDPTRRQLEFQSLPTSYLRLAAHRVAQHYHLQTTVLPDSSLPDGSGSRIILLKTSECYFPAVRLSDIPVSIPFEGTINNIGKVAIKQRPQRMLQTSTSASPGSVTTNQQKSVEERKEEYNKARARIFSGDISSSQVKPYSELTLPDDLNDCSLMAAKTEIKVCESVNINAPRHLVESSLAASRQGRGRIEKDPAFNRNNSIKGTARVAILRDRESDKKDPDYDRSYDRYMQRFDPGFGFSGGPYTVQPLYSPVANYNTEFPQLGTNHRPQLSIDHQPQQIPQHLCTPWRAASSPTALGYTSPEHLMPPFNANHVGPQPGSSLYLHPSPYVPSPRHGMPLVHPNEHMQPFVQAHQQQSETSFGLARPR